MLLYRAVSEQRRQVNGEGVQGTRKMLLKGTGVRAQKELAANILKLDREVVVGGNEYTVSLILKER